MDKERLMCKKKEAGKEATEKDKQNKSVCAPVEIACYETVGVWQRKKNTFTNAA